MNGKDAASRFSGESGKNTDVKLPVRRNRVHFACMYNVSVRFIYFQARNVTGVNSVAIDKFLVKTYVLMISLTIVHCTTHSRTMQNISAAR